MPKPTRLTIWMALIGTVLVMLAVYVLCVPYVYAVSFINRRTGGVVSSVTYWGVYRWPRPAGQSGHLDPSLSHMHTVDDEEIPYQIIIRRYVWSIPKFEEVQPGVGYTNAYYELFWSLRNEQAGKRTIPPDELDAIIKRRIQIWNSAELDRDPQAIADQARKENETLRALPVAPAK